MPPAQAGPTGPRRSPRIPDGRASKIRVSSRWLMTKTPLIAVLTCCVLAWTAHAGERAVIIVAGQSNVLNWHAAAAKLPADPRDAGILFYYETGAPPERGA